MEWGEDLVICVWFMYRVGDQVSFCNGPKNDEYYYKFQQVIAISREFFVLAMLTITKLLTG